MARQLLSWRRSVLADLVVSAILILAAVGCTLAWHWHTRRVHEREAALASLTQTTQSLAGSVDGFFDDGAALGRAIAFDEDVQSMDPVRFGPLLERQAAEHPRLNDLMVIDLSGAVLAHASASAALPASLRERAFFQRVVQTGEPAPIHETDPSSGSGPGTGVAVPIRSDTGEVRGVLALTFDLDRFEDHLERISLRAGQSLAIIDTRGRLVTLVRDQGPRVADLSWEQRDRSQLPEVQAALRGEPAASTSLVSAIDGRVRLAVLVPTPTYGWVVAATWAEDEALAPSQAEIQRDMLLMVAVAALVLLGIVATTRRVALPIRRLTAHIERLGDEDFAPVTGAWADNEIGRLAGAYNRMGARLQVTMQELRAEREHLTSLLEQLPVGVMEVAADDRRVLHLNSLADSFWPRSPEHRDHYDPADSAPAFHLDGRPLLTDERPVGRALRYGEETRGKEILLRRPGEPEIALRLNTSPVRDQQGRVVSAIQTFEDVTEQRKAAARLRERDRLLRGLVDQFPATISVVDRSYRVIMVGGQRHVTGPDQRNDDLIGKSLADLLPPDRYERYREQAERAFAGEPAVEDSIRGERTLRITTVPLRSDDGSIDNVMNIVVDVTEEEAQIARSAREEKLRALGQMAGGIAHDLNQSLTLVAGYGELAREALACDDGGPHPACEMIRIMERAAYDGGETVRQLLTFARGHAAEEQPQLIDAGSLLEEVQRLTAPRWRDTVWAEGWHIDFQVESAPDLVISGSHAALREVLTNLVFNAIDAMPAGGTLRLSARREAEQIVIDVADSGEGMTPEVKARAFDPFFTTKGASGTGLGLAMVFSIVQQHHGEIDVTSEVGQGATFHLRFPIAQVEEGVGSVSAVEPSAHVGRVLVVDDDAQLANLLASILRRHGHHALSVASAEEALNALGRDDIDLVISDLSMGDGMNGWELAAAVARSARPVPVVLATGWGAGINADEARARGVSAVLPKPYRREAVVAVVGELLSRQP